MVVRIAGKQIYLWRAVDDEGDVLEVLIQRRRNKAAACKLIPSCSGSRASLPPGSRPTGFDPMALRSRRLA
jgi:transposase-like protein